MQLILNCNGTSTKRALLGCKKKQQKVKTCFILDCVKMSKVLIFLILYLTLNPTLLLYFLHVINMHESERVLKESKYSRASFERLQIFRRNLAIKGRW